MISHTRLCVRVSVRVRVCKRLDWRQCLKITNSSVCNVYMSRSSKDVSYFASKCVCVSVSLPVCGLCVRLKDVHHNGRLRNMRNTRVYIVHVFVHIECTAYIYVHIYMRLYTMYVKQISMNNARVWTHSINSIYCMYTYTHNHILCMWNTSVKGVLVCTRSINSIWVCACIHTIIHNVCETYQ